MCVCVCSRMKTSLYHFISWKEMDSPKRVQILDESFSVSHSVNTVWIPILSLQLEMNSWADERFNLGMATDLWEGKLWFQTCLAPLKNWPYITFRSRKEVGKYVYIIFNIWSFDNLMNFFDVERLLLTSEEIYQHRNICQILVRLYTK